MTLDNLVVDQAYDLTWQITDLNGNPATMNLLPIEIYQQPELRRANHRPMGICNPALPPEMECRNESLALLTDPNGEAAMTLQLGQTAGPFVLRIFTGAPPSSYLCALDGQPDRASATLLEVSGNNQTAPPGETVPEPLVVRLEDQYGNPVPEATVMAEVTAGEAEVSQSPTAAVQFGTGSQVTVMTDDRGEARFSLFVRETATADITTTITAAGRTGPVVFLTLIERANVGAFPLVAFTR